MAEDGGSGTGGGGRGALLVAVVSSSTSLLLLGYIVFASQSSNKPLRRSIGNDDRAEYLDALCDSLDSLGSEEWSRVKSKLDVFLGLATAAPPPVSLPVAAPAVLPSPPAPPTPTTTTVASDPPVVVVAAAAAAPPPEDNDNPKLAAYRKMLKMGIPAQAVRNKMMVDQVDPALLFPDSSSSDAPAAAALSSSLPSSSSSAKTAPPQPPAAPLLLLPVEPICIDTLSPHSFWRNQLSDDEEQAAVSVDNDVAEAIKVLFHAKHQPPPTTTSKRTGAHAASTANSNANNDDDEDENVKPAATTSVSVLPPRRAQNILIGLIKLKRLSADELCEQIHAMSDALSLDDVLLLENILPTADEIKLVAAASATGKNSNLVDRFVDAAHRLCPDARQRVHSLAFLRQHGLLPELSQAVQDMTAFCTLVLAQVGTFASLLDCVRLVASALNNNHGSSSSRLGALSIRNLGDTLLKTKPPRSTSKITAAHLVLAQHGRAAATTALVDAFAALGGTLSSTMTTIAAVEAQLRQVERELATCHSLAGATHGVVDAQLSVQVGAVKTQVDALKDAYLCLLDVFGETPDRAFPLFAQDVLGLVACVRAASAAAAGNGEMLRQAVTRAAAAPPPPTSTTRRRAAQASSCA